MRFTLHYFLIFSIQNNNYGCLYNRFLTNWLMMDGWMDGLFAIKLLLILSDHMDMFFLQDDLCQTWFFRLSDGTSIGIVTEFILLLVILFSLFFPFPEL